MTLTLNYVCKQSFKGTVHRKIGRFKAAIQASTGHISTGKATTGLGLNSLRHRHQKILGDWRFNTEKNRSFYLNYAEPGCTKLGSLHNGV